MGPFESDLLDTWTLTWNSDSNFTFSSGGSFFILDCNMAPSFEVTCHPFTLPIMLTHGTLSYDLSGGRLDITSPTSFSLSHLIELTCEGASCADLPANQGFNMLPCSGQRTYGYTKAN